MDSKENYNSLNTQPDLEKTLDPSNDQNLLQQSEDKGDQKPHYDQQNDSLTSETEEKILDAQVFDSGSDKESEAYSTVLNE